jgi:endonuclease/exonuclease/phosphatase (EEP) superfamily protein YafD
MTMREFMGRSNAALREFHKIAAHLEHSTWTSRKIDRLGYTAAEGTAELKRYSKVQRPVPVVTKEPTVPTPISKREPLAFITANVWKDNPKIEPDLRLLVNQGAFAIGINEGQRFKDQIDRIAARGGYRVYGSDYGTAILLHEDVREVRIRTNNISDPVGDSPRRKVTEALFTLHGHEYVIQNTHMNAHVQAGQHKPQDLPRVQEYIDGMKIVTGMAARHREQGRRVITMGDMNWAWSPWDLRQWLWSPQAAFKRRAGMKCQFDKGMLPRPKADGRPIEYVFWHPKDFTFVSQKFIGPESSDHPFHEVTLRPRG